MIERPEYRSKMLRNNLAWQSRFSILGVAVSLFFCRRRETPALVGAQLALLLLSFAQHTWLVTVRPKVSYGKATFLYFLNLGVVACMIWISNATSADIPRVWSPFEGFKLIALAAPLFAPARPGLGALGTLFIALLVGLQYHGFSPEVRSRLVEDEPWVTLAFSAFGLVLCALRMWTQKLMNRELKCRVEANAMKRLNSRLHALRDLTNTPLMTVRVGTRLLRNRYPMATDVELLDRIDRAVERVEEVNRIQREEDSVEQQRHDLSFDARKRLKLVRNRVRQR